MIGNVGLVLDDSAAAFVTHTGDLHVADLATGTLVRSLSPQHAGSAVASMTVLGDGKMIATGQADGTILIWDVARLPAMTPSVTSGVETRRDADGEPLPPAAHARLGSRRYRFPSYPSAVAATPDGRRIAIHGARGYAVWDSDTGLRIAAWPAPREEECQRLLLSLDGRFLAAAAGTGLRIFDIASRRTTWLQTMHERRIDATAFDTSGRWLVSGDMEGLFCLWDVERQQLAWAIRLPPLIRPIALAGLVSQSTSPKLPPRRRGRRPIIAPDTPAIPVVDEGEIVFWDPPTRREKRKGDPDRHRGIINVVAVSPDGAKIVSGDSKGGARVWSAFTYAPIMSIPKVSQEDGVEGAGFVRTEIWTWTDDNRISFLKMSDGRPRATWKSDERLYCVAGARDGGCGSRMSWAESNRGTASLPLRG